MVNDNRNLVNFTMVTAGFLMWLVAYLMFELLAGHSSSIARAWSNQTVHHILPIMLGILLFVVLRSNTKAVAFTDDVISELKKVSWPEPQMTWGLTWRVCIILTIAGLIVSGYDVVWAYLINLIVKG